MKNVFQKQNPLDKPVKKYSTKKTTSINWIEYWITTEWYTEETREITTSFPCTLSEKNTRREKRKFFSPMSLWLAGGVSVAPLTSVLQSRHFKAGIVTCFTNLLDDDVVVPDDDLRAELLVRVAEAGTMMSSSSSIHGDAACHGNEEARMRNKRRKDRNNEITWDTAFVFTHSYILM